MIGKNIEHYKVIEILGQGGMGTVYKAFDLKLERFIAIKILNSDFTSNPHFLERFKREAKHQAKLSHPNIVPVYGLTETSGIFGIVMEYVSGETVENMIKRNGRLDVRYASLILKQVLQGIGYAHQKGFIHRDIKPSNIIVNTEGVVKIMDFGISKSITDSRTLTKTGTKIGTILYMSPEQIKAKELTNQSDIYSLGITFYEMLMGKTPFERGTDYEIMESHLKRNPDKISSQIPEVPSSVDAIILKATQKSLAKRYKTCDEFLDDINDVSAEFNNSISKKNKKLTKTKRKTRTLIEIKDVKTFKIKVRYYFYMFLTLVVFGALFYFVYNSVSQYWKNDQYTKKIKDKGKDNYKSNPSFILKSSWQKVNSSTTLSINSITFVNKTIGFACGENGLLLTSNDGGNNWNKIDNNFTETLYSIKFISQNEGIAVGSKGIILKTYDGGVTWEKINSSNKSSLFDIAIVNSSTLVAVGANGEILRSEDGGNSWNTIDLSVSSLLYSVKFIDDSKGFVVGWNGVLLETVDGGLTWNKHSKFTNNYLRSIDFVNDEDGFIVGGGGEIYKTTNSGDSWNKIPSNTISGLLKVKFINENYGVIIGNKGEILISDDNGENWESISSGTFSTLKGISFIDSKKIFIAGNNGLIIKSDIVFK